MREKIFYVDGVFLAKMLGFQRVRAMQIALTQAKDGLHELSVDDLTEQSAASVIHRACKGTVKLPTSGVIRPLSFGAMSGPVSNPRKKKLVRSFFDSGICTSGRGNLSVEVSFSEQDQKASFPFLLTSGPFFVNT